MYDSWGNPLLDELRQSFIYLYTTYAKLTVVFIVWNKNECIMSEYFSLHSWIAHGYLSFVSNLNVFFCVDYILKPVSYEISTNSSHLIQDKCIWILLVSHIPLESLTRITYILNYVSCIHVMMLLIKRYFKIFINKWFNNFLFFMFYIKILWGF